MPKATQSPSEPSFESALERLEQIVQEMEGDRLPLEDLLARYEEGTRLVKVCQRRLDSAEKRIEIIAREASGDVTLNAFDASGSGAGGSTGQSSASAGVPASMSAVKGSATISKRSAPEDVSLF